MNRKFRGWLWVRVLKRRQEVKGERGSSGKWKEFGDQAEHVIGVNNSLARIDRGIFFFSKLFIDV